jgi:hypothetical protein
LGLGREIVCVCVCVCEGGKGGKERGGGEGGGTYEQVDWAALSHPLVEGLEERSSQQILDVIGLGVGHGDVLRDEACGGRERRSQMHGTGRRLHACITVRAHPLAAPEQVELGEPPGGLPRLACSFGVDRLAHGRLILFYKESSEAAQRPARATSGHALHNRTRNWPSPPPMRQPHASSWLPAHAGA